MMTFLPMPSRFRAISPPSDMDAAALKLPIGVFDSGVGGLSVQRHLHELLPQENFIYFADSAHAPYGSKTGEFIVRRSLAIGGFLLQHNVKALVVACNTATSAAIEILRQQFTVPIIGMEPGVKPAVEATKSGVVGILATTNTLSGHKYAKLRDQFQDHARIINQPCPGLVERIERGHLDDAATRSLAQSYIEPLLDAGADVLVLGCTHYPFIRGLIEEIAGPAVTIIDTGPAIARELMRRLRDVGGLSTDSERGETRYFTSGDAKQQQHVVEKILMWKIDMQVARI